MLADNAGEQHPEHNLEALDEARQQQTFRPHISPLPSDQRHIGAPAAAGEQDPPSVTLWKGDPMLPVNGGCLVSD
ncbi:hypothetical protein [Pseudomonas sp.]|uniref:hypothetical protein n=1 Tax=Pseudomonas sp. TaxID=306 RepID=UPI003A983FF8